MDGVERVRFFNARQRSDGKWGIWYENRSIHVAGYVYPALLRLETEEEAKAIADRYEETAKKRDEK